MGTDRRLSTFNTRQNPGLKPPSALIDGDFSAAQDKCPEIHIRHDENRLENERYPRM